MRTGEVKFAAEAGFGAWGRNGRIRQFGLSAHVLDGQIILEPVTSRGQASGSAQMRVPVAEVQSVIEMLKSLS